MRRLVCTYHTSWFPSSCTTLLAPVAVAWSCRKHTHASYASAPRSTMSPTCISTVPAEGCGAHAQSSPPALVTFAPSNTSRSPTPSPWMSPTTTNRGWSCAVAGHVCASLHDADAAAAAAADLVAIRHPGKSVLEMASAVLRCFDASLSDVPLGVNKSTTDKTVSIKSRAIATIVEWGWGGWGQRAMSRRRADKKAGYPFLTPDTTPKRRTDNLKAGTDEPPRQQDHGGPTHTGSRKKKGSRARF